MATDSPERNRIAHEGLVGTVAAAVCGVLGVLGAGSTTAADWNFEPRVALSAEYNDNYRMTDVPGTEVEVSGGALDAALKIGAASPQTTFYVTPRIRSTLYPGESAEEGDSYYVSLGVEHKTQKSFAKIDANYSREEPIWGYLPASGVSGDLGNPTPGEDIGSSQIRQQAERFDVTPGLSLALSPRYTLDFGIQYIDVNFSPEVEFSNISYTYLRGSVGLGYKMSETSEIRLNGGLGRYDPSGGIATDGYALNAEWSRRMSETQQLYVRAGANRVQVYSGNGSDMTWEYGFSGGAGVRWSWAVTDLVLDATHYIDPNSSGSVVVRDQLQFRLSRRLGPLTNVFIGARAIKDSGVGNQSKFVDTDYETASIGFDWRFSRQFSLSGGYTYSRRKYQPVTSDAQSNFVSLAVVYEPKRP